MYIVGKEWLIGSPVALVRRSQHATNCSHAALVLHRHCFFALFAGTRHAGATEIESFQEPGGEGFKNGPYGLQIVLHVMFRALVLYNSMGARYVLYRLRRGFATVQLQVPCSTLIRPESRNKENHELLTWRAGLSSAYVLPTNNRVFPGTWRGGLQKPSLWLASCAPCDVPCPGVVEQHVGPLCFVLIPTWICNGATAGALLNFTPSWIQEQRKSTNCSHAVLVLHRHLFFALFAGTRHASATTIKYFQEPGGEGLKNRRYGLQVVRHVMFRALVLYSSLWARFVSYWFQGGFATAQL
jgi:hypothetical protein